MQYSVLAHVVLPTPVASNTGVGTRVQLELREGDKFVCLVLLSDNLLADVESATVDPRAVRREAQTSSAGYNIVMRCSQSYEALDLAC